MSTQEDWFGTGLVAAVLVAAAAAGEMRKGSSVSTGLKSGLRFRHAPKVRPDFSGWSVESDPANAGQFSVIHILDKKQMAYDLTRDQATGLVVLIEAVLPGLGRRKLTNADVGTLMKEVMEQATDDDLVWYARQYAPA